MTKTVEQRRRAFQMLDVIEANPDKHDQSMWCFPHCSAVTAESALSACGTTACGAGWTVLLAGLTIQSTMVVETGLRVSRQAADLLGLSLTEADDLFYADDLAGVRKVVNEIFGPRPDGEPARCETCGESLREIAAGTLGHIPGEACAPVEADLR